MLDTAWRLRDDKEGAMLGFLIRAALVALGLWLATDWVSGVSIDTPSTLILAGILLGVVNSIIRPIAILLTLPMTILTLGLFLLVINAGIVGSWFVGGKGRVEVIRRRS
jgi:putative membrane protein